MKKLNLPNKITVCRIILSFLLLIMLIIPWEQIGVEWPVYSFKNELINLKYLIAGGIFLIAASTDFIDGYIARKYNLITDFGKTADAIADKLLVNGLLVILAYDRIIPLLIPVIIISRDIITDSCKSICGSKGKVVAASKLGKAKTIFMMIGITLTLFYDFPFIYLNIYIGEIFIIIATVISIISGVEYVMNSSKYLFDEKKS